ncbi:hypothetical protein STEG23_019047, partial [Scotinomys teguina]
GTDFNTETTYASSLDTYWCENQGEYSLAHDALLFLIIYFNVYGCVASCPEKYKRVLDLIELRTKSPVFAQFQSIHHKLMLASRCAMARQEGQRKEEAGKKAKRDPDHYGENNMQEIPLLDASSSIHIYGSSPLQLPDATSAGPLLYSSQMLLPPSTSVGPLHYSSQMPHLWVLSTTAPRCHICGSSPLQLLDVTSVGPLLYSS